MLNDKLEVLADGCRPFASDEELDTDTSLMDRTTLLSDAVTTDSLDVTTMLFDGVVEPLEITDPLPDVGGIVEDDVVV